MTAKPPGPNLEEIDARIAEAAEWGNKPAEKLARRQKEWVKREFAKKRRRRERGKAL